MRSVVGRVYIGVNYSSTYVKLKSHIQCICMYILEGSQEGKREGLGTFGRVLTRGLYCIL